MTALLELVNTKPDWFGALEICLRRPEGVPERRSADNHWEPSTDRPRRISDDLAWLRQAVDEPRAYGLKPLDDTAAVAVWEAESEVDRLCRLRDRGILGAAGFLLHEPSGLPEGLEEGVL